VGGDVSVIVVSLAELHTVHAKLTVFRKHATHCTTTTTTVLTSSYVRDLGTDIDADLFIKSYVCRMLCPILPFSVSCAVFDDLLRRLFNFKF